jgi:hypothetical protein
MATQEQVTSKIEDMVWAAIDLGWDRKRIESEVEYILNLAEEEGEL